MRVGDEHLTIDLEGRRARSEKIMTRCHFWSTVLSFAALFLALMDYGLLSIISCVLLVATNIILYSALISIKEYKEANLSLIMSLTLMLSIIMFLSK